MVYYPDTIIAGLEPTITWIFFYSLQFIILLFITAWTIKYSQPVSFEFNDIIITTSTSVLIIGLLIIILTALLLQRLVFFLKQSSQKYKFYRFNVLQISAI